MKRHSNLIEQIASLNNLIIAFKKASKGKKNKQYVKFFYLNLETNLFQIQEDLLSGNYRWGVYHFFEISDNKKRQIHAPIFKDRVTQHAIYAVLEPLLDKKFIYHTYACRKGKGTLRGVQSLMKMNANENTYILKCDIKQYFKTIDRQIMFELLQYNMKDKLVLKAFYNLIFYDEEKRGIPIGNLCSQLFANLYLSQLDYFVKHVLKTKYYLRYMDDFLIIHTSREQLYEWRHAIRDFLTNNLKLELHPNKQHITAAAKGINWLGYKVTLSKLQVRNKNNKAFSKRWKAISNKKGSSFQDFRVQINSLYALSKHANTRKYIYKTYRSQFYEKCWVYNLTQLRKQNKAIIDFEC